MEATGFLLVGEEEPGNPSPGFQSHIGCGVWGRQREKWASPLSASPQGCLGAALSRGRNGEVGGEPCAVGRDHGAMAGRTCFTGMDLSPHCLSQWPFLPLPSLVELS